MSKFKILTDLPWTIIFFQSGFDVVSVFYNALCTICSLIRPSLFCYYATVATDRLSSVANKVYDTTWYEYPLKLQQFTILIIARSQDEVNFTGFNDAHFRCTLEIFAKVTTIHKLCSYSSQFLKFNSIFCRLSKHLARTMLYSEVCNVNLFEADNFKLKL